MKYNEKKEKRRWRNHWVRWDNFIFKIDKLKKTDIKDKQLYIITMSNNRWVLKTNEFNEPNNIIKKVHYPLYKVQYLTVSYKDGF